MALSDGATSARYAREAAGATVKGIIQYFEEHTLEDFLALDPEEQKQTILSHVLHCLVLQARESGCSDPREFSATMLFLVNDGRKVICGHLGDGAVFLADSDNNIVYTSAPDNVEGSSTRTYFTVTADAAQHLRITELDVSADKVSQALMTSDGAYLMFYNRGGRDPSRTAGELLSYVNSGEITSNEDLRDAISQMAEIASERLDDWSVIICSDREEPSAAAKPEPVSMLAEELEKYGRDKETNA